MSFKEIFCTFKDKLTGKKVIWYKKGYEDVKKDHKEIETHFYEVKGAIENPDIIKKDLNHKRRKCYYLYFRGGHNYPNCHMKVVVGKTVLGRLKIITAYFTNTIKQGEKEIWSKINKKTKN